MSVCQFASLYVACMRDELHFALHNIVLTFTITINHKNSYNIALRAFNKKKQWEEMMCWLYVKILSFSFEFDFCHSHLHFRKRERKKCVEIKLRLRIRWHYVVIKSMHSVQWSDWKYLFERKWNVKSILKSLVFSTRNSFI